MTRTLTLIALFLIPHSAFGDKLELIRKFGNPMQGSKSLTQHRDGRVSWLDDSKLITWKPTGILQCYDLSTDKTLWSRTKTYFVSQWSLHEPTKRLAIKYLQTKKPSYSNREIIAVISCKTGGDEFKFATRKAFDESVDHSFFDGQFAIYGPLSLHPSSGNLVLTRRERKYGMNAAILNSDYSKVLKRFPIDASVKSLSFSLDGSRVAIGTSDDVFCVRDIQQNADLFLRGKRTFVEPREIAIMIGPPGLVSLVYDGIDTIVSHYHGGCFGQASLSVETLSTGKSITHRAERGRLPYHVDFKQKRIALASSEHNLNVIDFSGKVCAKSRRAVRIASVAFSPNGDRIAILRADGRLALMHFKKE